MYILNFAKIVQKQQKKIPKGDLEKMKEIILSLRENPRPLKTKKLVGGNDEYRIRYGNYRILYSIDDKKKEVIVYGILDRKEAYR